MAWPKMFAKGVPERSARAAPVQPDIFYLNSGIGVAVVKWSDRIAAVEAMKHPIVYRALNKLASSVQQMRWVVEENPDASADERKDKSTVIQELQNVLDHPGGDMSPAMLRYWMTLNYAVYGRTPLKIGVSALDLKKPNAIYPLEAAHVRVVLNTRGTVDKYEYGMGEKKESYMPREKANSKGYAGQIWKPGLKGYQHHNDQNTPLATVGLPAQVIRSLLVRAIQTAEGHPNVRYMVTCSRTLTGPQKEALKQHLEDHTPQSGDDKVGSIPIIQNAGDIEIHTVDNDLSDIHSKMPSDDMARLIFGAFGIPIALAGIGAADAAKFTGNFDSSRLAFWQDTVIPEYVNPLFQGLTRMICPAGVRISPNLLSIPALAAGRIRDMKETNAVNFLTTTEKRDIFGLKPNSALPETMPATDTTSKQPEA